MRLLPLAALAVGLAGASHAQGVPEPLRGAWFAGECAAPSAALFVTARAAARIPADGASRLLRFTETRRAGAWLVGSAAGAEAPRLLLRGRGEALDTAEPEAKARDDRLPGEAPITAWRRCAPAPAGLASAHGEGVAFLVALEHMEAACGGALVLPGQPMTGGGDGRACATAIVAQGDVSGDRLLSVAEIARLVRGAGWLLAVQEGGDAAAITAAVGAGALVGIIAARLIVESVDYDGDGRVSAAELAQDWGAFASGGNPAGSPLRLDGIGEAAGVLRGLAEGLAGSR